MVIFRLPHRNPMSAIHTYSPHISQTRTNCPHTYGVRMCPCAALATEPGRPTACISLPHPSTVPCPLPPVRWTFTFSAKERDTETGYSYFGSRYYSSDLSIWLSVDPQASKYPSLSPYVYCADNPVKIVDLNGEEIWIVGDDGVRYKYNNGNFYTKEGNIYTPESDSFLSKAGNAIDKLKGTKTGNRLISFFEGSDNKDVIIESGSQSTCDNLTLDFESGEFVSQTIRWNSEGTNIETTAGEQKNSTADLGHEFSHVYDNAKNIKGLRDLCPNKGSRSEWRAVYRENCMREEMGLPYRTGYTFRNPDNSTYFVSMLNRKGKPYMPNSFQWTPFEICKKKIY